MNAGAYGGELAQVLVSAEAVDRSGKPSIASAPPTWASAIATATAPADWIFTSARLRATPGDQLAIARRIAEIDAARTDSQPRSRTGGSTFVNPPGHKAWELIDRAGCRGLRIGEAQVSEKHCNFLINLGAATRRRHRGAGRGGAPARARAQRRAAGMGDPAHREWPA